MKKRVQLVLLLQKIEERCSAKSKLKTVNVTCPHDCPDTCSLKVTVDTSLKKAIHLTDDNTHPITKGFYVIKLILDLVYNENRVLYPHIRIGPKARIQNLKELVGIMHKTCN